MKTVHVSLFVRGALLWRDAQLRGLFRLASGGTLDAREARHHLMDCLAGGSEFLPLGPCDNFDPKRGCLGHERG